MAYSASTTSADGDDSVTRREGELGVFHSKAGKEHHAACIAHDRVVVWSYHNRYEAQRVSVSIVSACLIVSPALTLSQHVKMIKAQFFFVSSLRLYEATRRATEKYNRSLPE